MVRRKKVLFICTGNSCRSQMAEGFLRHLAGDKLEVFSAGLEPTVVNPLSIRVMAEAGIDISNHRSKSLDEFTSQSFDLIVTVCDQANRACPFFPGEARRLHWSLTDPAQADGTEEEILRTFRQVRDQIHARIEALIDEMDSPDFFSSSAQGV